jgi:hypothetical protein
MRLRGSSLSGVVPVALLFCAGCSPNLNNVRVYADGLVALGDKLEPVAEDFQRSCYRGAEMSYLAKRAAKPGDAATERAAEAAYLQDGALCEAWKGKPEAYSASLAVVTAYGSALQRLTADETVDYGEELKEMAAATDGLSGELAGKNLDDVVGKGFTNASRGLAGTLAKWVSEGYRRGEVKQAILEGAPGTGVILGGLHRFADDVYKQTFLIKEHARIRVLYGLLEAGADAQLRAVVVQQRARLEAEHDARLKRVDTLLSHLTAAATANRALLSKAKEDDLDAEQLFEEVKPLVKELLGVAKAWKDVHWKHEHAATSGEDTATPAPEGDT